MTWCRYRCEVTYEDQVGRWYSDSCLVAHTTNLVVEGRPDTVQLTYDYEDGAEAEVAEDGAIIGPFAEGRTLVLR